MNKLSFIKYILLIAMLLGSQVGSAYVTMPVMQSCGMDMSMDVEAGHSMQMMNDASNGNSPDNMNCCDMDMMNASVASCCDAQCQCSSFVSSLFLTSEKPMGSASYQGENVVIHRVTAMHTPFLQQPKRPPIRNFS